MKNSYEKILLVIAALILVGMITLGAMKLGAVSEDFPDASENPKEALPIETESLVNKAAKTLSKPMAMDEMRMADGRKIDSFTAANLYVRRGSDAPVVIDDPKQEPVHPPIPNEWWLSNSMSEEIGYGDAPQRDFDGDGFSNLEEFNEKSNPNDKNSFPSLFAKLRLASVEKEQWYLRFSDFGGGQFSFRCEGTADGMKRKIENRMRNGKAISPGTVFFEEGEYQGRFKFIETFEKEVRNVPKTFVRIEDLKSGKEGKVYEFASGAHKTLVSDYTARLFLDTPDLSDQKFAVEEGVSFSLPYDENATEKPYTLKEIRGEGASALLLWNNNGETTELELKLEK